MNASYIIADQKNVIFNIDENKCIHNEDNNIISTKIEKLDDNIFKMSYNCSKCNKTIITMWEKSGRFYRNIN